MRASPMPFPRPTTRPVPAWLWPAWTGSSPRRWGAVQAQDRFLDLGATCVRIRDLGADDRETRRRRRPEPTHVVAGRPGAQGAGANRVEQQRERPAGDAPPPQGPVDPVGHLG